MSVIQVVQVGIRVGAFFQSLPVCLARQDPSLQVGLGTDHSVRERLGIFLADPANAGVRLFFGSRDIVGLGEDDPECPYEGQPGAQCPVSAYKDVNVAIMLGSIVVDPTREFPHNGITLMGLHDAVDKRGAKMEDGSKPLRETSGHAMTSILRIATYLIDDKRDDGGP